MSSSHWLIEMVNAVSRRVLELRVVRRLTRTLIDPTAGRIFSEHFPNISRGILDQIWSEADQEWATSSAPQVTPGAMITVRLASVTAAAYRTLLARGAAPEEATQCVYDIAWAIYKKMGTFAWMTSGIVTRDPVRRLRVATVAFRTFPFSSPSYGWKDVPTAADTVGFDCLQCPVAEYFKTQHLSELCVRTWCALDFPLADDVWHSHLERSGSIAGGASHCDFRWTAHPPVRAVK